MLDIVSKIGAPLRNSLPPGVPSWLRACYTAKKIPHECTCSIRIFWNRIQVELYSSLRKGCGLLSVIV